MPGPVYSVCVTHKGSPYNALVQALPMKDGWAIGYLTPTGRIKKLTVRGNERATETEKQCIDRLRQIAFFRRWREIQIQKEDTE